MELLQLRYFYETAQTGSFAKTAEKYMVPPSSVSASVKRLEKELGCQLFDRSSNRIGLNEKGLRLQQTLQGVFSALDGVSAELRGGEEVRLIRILVRGMRRKVTAMIGAYCQMFPGIRFHTVFDFREQDLSQFDIIVDQSGQGYPGYDKFELLSRKLHFVCKAGDPLCGRKLTVRDLAGRCFVSMGEGSNLHGVLMETCRRAGFTPEISVLCNDIECYEAFVASGMGIAISTLKDDRKGLAYLDVADFDERYTVSGYCKKDSCGKVVTDFLSFMKREAEKL